jgi:hypothetical protein
LILTTNDSALNRAAWRQLLRARQE